MSRARRAAVWTVELLRALALAGPILVSTLWHRVGYSGHASIMSEVRARLGWRHTEQEIGAYLKRHADFETFCERRRHSGTHSPPS